MFNLIRDFATTKISRLNLEQKELSDEKLNIQRQISDIQEMNEAMSSAFSMITSGVSSQAQSIFNSTISDANATVTQAQSIFNMKKNEGLTGEALKEFEAQVEQAKDDAKEAQKTAYQKYQMQMNAVAALTQSYKNVQAAEEKARIKELNRKEDRIEIRLNNIRTELTLLEKEQESASQAATQQAQKFAPQFA